MHYKLYDSLFTGNKNLTGTGGGPAINAKPTDPSFLELVNSKVSDTRMTLEMNQNKRNYLHAVEGTEEARIGAGLFLKGKPASRLPPLRMDNLAASFRW